MGTIINAALIVVGSLIGLIFKKAINEKIEYSVHKATGIAVLVIGLCGILSTMLSVTGGKISSSGELMLVVSLALGAFIGEVLKLDDRLNNGCKKIEGKFNMPGFANGFISATMIFCILYPKNNSQKHGYVTLISIRYESQKDPAYFDYENKESET